MPGRLPYLLISTIGEFPSGESSGIYGISILPYETRQVHGQSGRGTAHIGNQHRRRRGNGFGCLVKALAYSEQMLPVGGHQVRVPANSDKVLRRMLLFERVG